MAEQKPRPSLFRRQWRKLLVLLVLAGAMWGVMAFDYFADAYDFKQFGIRPGERDSLSGIAFAPFIHGDWQHLASNTLPFVVLGWIVVARSGWHFLFVTLVSAAASGLGSWWFGEHGTFHVGASGLVFGYFGYVFSLAFFERSLSTMGLAVLVGFLYGSLVWGLLPGKEGISWEGHVCGLLGGLACGFMLARRPRIRR